jgi:hypothetical protein
MLHTRFHAIGKRWPLLRMAVFASVLAWLVPVHGQQPSTAPTAAPKPASDQTSSTKNDPNAEVTIQDSGTTFRLRVNLVQVHVVVRDANGNPVGNLKQEDFQLFDQGKLQPISLFSVETRETRREKAEAAALMHTGKLELTSESKTVLPDRFIALFFDDSHLSLEDARYVRTGVAKFLDSLAPTDRVGLFTASQQLYVTFTNDKAALQRALEGLVPRPKFVPQFRECPDISHYEAVKLQIFSQLQMQGIHFRKAGGTNLDNLTVATAIFDANGNFVVGAQKTLEMKLEDATYEKLMQGGLAVKSSFDLKPGKYLVRQVIRDSEGSQMAARNGAVNIPD